MPSPGMDVIRHPRRLQGTQQVLRNSFQQENCLVIIFNLMKLVPVKKKKKMQGRYSRKSASFFSPRADSLVVATARQVSLTYIPAPRGIAEKWEGFLSSGSEPGGSALPTETGHKEANLETKVLWRVHFPLQTGQSPELVSQIPHPSRRWGMAFGP